MSFYAPITLTSLAAYVELAEAATLSGIRNGVEYLTGKTSREQLLEVAAQIDSWLSDIRTEVNNLIDNVDVQNPYVKSVGDVGTVDAWTSSGYIAVNSAERMVYEIEDMGGSPDYVTYDFWTSAMSIPAKLETLHSKYMTELYNLIDTTSVADTFEIKSGKALKFADGSDYVTEISSDGTFADNSETALVTEKAIKTFVLASVSGTSGSSGSSGTDGTSGTTGAAGTSGSSGTSGTSASTIHYLFTNHAYYTVGTGAEYIPLNGSLLEGASVDSSRQIAAPFDGNIMEILIYSSGVGGSTAVTVYVNGGVGDTDTQTQPSKTTTTYDVSSAGFSRGDLISVKVDSTTALGDVNVTLRWKVDTST